MTNWELKMERKKHWYWRFLYSILNIKHCRHWGENHWYSNLIAWNIENPFKTYWKARKYFKCPKLNISFCTSKYHFPYASKYWQGKLLDINIHDVLWKDKWDSPRHERNPLIYICLFGKFSVWITPKIYYKDEFGENKLGDMEYWEYLLEWLYYKEKKTLRCYSGWTGTSKLYKQRVKTGNSEDGSEDVYEPARYTVPCVAMSLNKRGIKELKKELNK